MQGVPKSREPLTARNQEESKKAQTRRVKPKDL